MARASFGTRRRGDSPLFAGDVLGSAVVGGPLAQLEMPRELLRAIDGLRDLGRAPCGRFLFLGLAPLLERAEVTIEPEEPDDHRNHREDRHFHGERAYPRGERTMGGVSWRSPDRHTRGSSPRNPVFLREWGRGGSPSFAGDARDPALRTTTRPKGSRAHR